MFRPAIAVLLLALPTGRLTAQDTWPRLECSPRNFVGTLSCSSTSCHGRTEPLFSSAIQRQEFLHYLEHDPHARAAQRLNEPRFLQVLQAASAHNERAADGCAACHDPLGLASSAKGLPLGRGIGCESCHGAAQQWLDKHYLWANAREQLAAFGFRDTKQVLVRARICAECHVGGAGRDVNHDLLAAGHPPLQFELASHQALITRKHWDDAPRRLREPDYEAQLWAAGRVASADAALSLLVARATSDPRSAPWPEFAESNCRACHQALRPAAGGSRRGLPWQTWNLALVPDWPELTTLRAEMERALVPPRDRIAVLAASAQSALRQQARLALTRADILKQLAVPPPATNWDWACQELAALLAVRRPGEALPLPAIAAKLRRPEPPLAEVSTELTAIRRQMSENGP